MGTSETGPDRRAGSHTATGCHEDLKRKPEVLSVKINTTFPSTVTS